MLLCRSLTHRRHNLIAFADCYVERMLMNVTVRVVYANLVQLQDDLHLMPLSRRVIFVLKYAMIAEYSAIVQGRNVMKRVALIAVLLAIVGAGAIATRGSRPSISDVSLDAVVLLDDETAIFSTVIRELYARERSDLHALTTTLYILNPSTASASPDAPETRQFSRLLQQRIEAELTDLPVPIIWITDHADAPTDAAGMVIDGRILALGSVEWQSATSVHVAGSSYRGPLWASGRMYVVEQINETWVITGTTGPEWIA